MRKSQRKRKGKSLLDKKESVKQTPSPHSKLSNSQSKRSIVLSKKQPCDSHQFYIAPISKHQNVYYTDTLKINFTHEQKNLRPFPVLLKDFIKASSIPLFGLQSQIPIYRRNEFKYKSNLQEQQTKMSSPVQQSNILLTPVPKHKYCQICKQQFQIYEKHILQISHIRTGCQSFGNQWINQCLQSYVQATFQQSEDNALMLICDLRSVIQDMIPVIRQKFNNFLQDLEIVKDKK